MFPILELIQHAQATLWTISALVLVAFGCLFAAIRLSLPTYPARKEPRDQYAD